MDYSKVFTALIGPVSLLIGFLLKSLWSGNKSEMNELKQAIKDNSHVTAVNTLALQKLTVQMDNVEEKLDIVGELRRDVDKMGASLRSHRKGDGPDDH